MPGWDTKDALIKTVTFEAAVSAHAACVWGGAEDRVTLPAAANADDFAGFSVYDQAAGSQGPLHMAAGVAKARAGGAIGLGKKCNIAGNTGKIAQAAPAAGANAHVVCRALRAASADGDVIPVLVIPETMQG